MPSPPGEECPGASSPSPVSTNPWGLQPVMPRLQHEAPSLLHSLEGTGKLSLQVSVTCPTSALHTRR